MGVPAFIFFIVFYKHYVRQYASKLLLWECPCSCFVLCFTCVQAIAGYHVASVGVPTFMFCIVLPTYWGNLRLARCLCGSALAHVWYCLSHSLRQPQASALPLWQCPRSWFDCVLHGLRQPQASALPLRQCHRSCFVLCFAHLVTIAVQQIASVRAPSPYHVLCFTCMKAMSA